MRNRIKMQKVRKDLKNGNGLEDTLVKHKTTLKKVFNDALHDQKHPRKTEIDGFTYIFPTPYNSYRVSKVFGKKTIYCGSYTRLKDAQYIRDKMIEYDWDTTMLPELKNKLWGEKV